MLFFCYYFWAENTNRNVHRDRIGIIVVVPGILIFLPLGHRPPHPSNHLLSTTYSFAGWQQWGQYLRTIQSFWSIDCKLRLFLGLVDTREPRENPHLEHRNSIQKDQLVTQWCSCRKRHCSTDIYHIPNSNQFKLTLWIKRLSNSKARSNTK